MAQSAGVWNATWRKITRRHWCFRLNWQSPLWLPCRLPAVNLCGAPRRLLATPGLPTTAIGFGRQEARRLPESSAIWPCHRAVVRRCRSQCVRFGCLLARKAHLDPFFNQGECSNPPRLYFPLRRAADRPSATYGYTLQGLRVRLDNVRYFGEAASLVVVLHQG